MPTDRQLCEDWIAYLSMNFSLSEKFQEDTSYLEKERVIGKVVYSKDPPYIDLKIGEFVDN